MKKEYVLVFIIGVFILTYVLDAVVDPLTVDLSTPYQYFGPQIFGRFPFTSASIFLKGTALFLTPLFFLSFMDKQHLAKGSILLVISGLTQLYALQELITNAQVLPLEWTISITLAGIMLLIPSVIYYIKGFFATLHEKIVGEEEEIDF